MLISIVIPTRERVAYLPSSVATATSIDDPRIEILVSDNASQDGTAEAMAEIKDPRVRYVNTGRRISMRQNFEFALGHVRGDYVIYFGDDDGILPGQFPFLRGLLERHTPDGISWPRATYGWPVPGYGRKTGGVRFFHDKLFGLPEAYDPREAMPRLLSADLSAFDRMPDIYHGCMSRTYMASLAGTEGTFDSAIPDVNISYKAVFHGGDFLHLRHPFTINGYSPASTGGGFSATQRNTSGQGTQTSFTREAMTDPVLDAFGNAGSVALAFFATLESVRQKGNLDERPDYAAWYDYVLRSVRKNRGIREQVDRILSDHAKATGTEAALAEAAGGADRFGRKFRAWTKKVAQQTRSFRLSAEIEGQNDISTAAAVMDETLGQDLACILDGTLSRGVAWSNARRRSRQFTRTL